VTPLGDYLERCRQLHGHPQAQVARDAGMKTAEYRALITRDIPPPTFDQLVSLAAAAGADPTRAATYAWSMTWDEALELGLPAMAKPDNFAHRLSQPTLRRKTSNAQVWVNIRR
jgi:transcriptional regulator with XRE-family HTH domain